MKCDIIIPVYKSPEWVKLCVYAVCRNTEYINKVYLINDCDDIVTINCLNNLASKYSCVEVLQNDSNMGFVKTCNKGMEVSSAKYVLLLNTDCIITSRTIGKLINHMEKDKEIGLICPIASNAANLTLEMFGGFSYNDMDLLLEKKFKGKNFDACTVVGNCLMISRDCIEKTGYLDEIYGMGYGEETDYQFKAMKNGFKAKVAIDSYVFHKAEVSFGVSKEKQERQKKNQEIFFSRWGNDYYKLMNEYSNNDPIRYIHSNITKDDKKLSFEFLMYLIGFNKAAGGINMAVDMINYLTINDVKCNILYGFSNGYDEIMLFNPILVTDASNYSFKKIVSTIYFSNYYAKMLAQRYDVPLVSFAQGYEPYFENGLDYRVAELSYKLPDRILTISDYLKDMYKESFNVKADVVRNGINSDLLCYKNNQKKIKTVTLFCRNNYLKGDFITLDIFNRLVKKYSNLNINLLYLNKDMSIPFYDKDKNDVKLLKGPFTRVELASIFIDSDLYIDTSLTEGFGLMPLEAMASGNVVVTSNSGGVRDYIDDGINGYLIDNVNDVDSYMEKIDSLISDDNLYLKIKNKMVDTVSKFDFDDVVLKYINYFSKDIEKTNYELDVEEKRLYFDILDSRFKVSDKKGKNFIYKVAKKMPKGVKLGIKRFVNKLYSFTNDH